MTTVYQLDNIFLILDVHHDENRIYARKSNAQLEEHFSKTPTNRMMYRISTDSKSWWFAKEGTDVKQFIKNLPKANTAMNQEARLFLWYYTIEKLASSFLEEPSLRQIFQRGGVELDGLMPHPINNYVWTVIEDALEAKLITFKMYNTLQQEYLPSLAQFRVDEWRVAERALQYVLKQARLNNKQDEDEDEMLAEFIEPWMGEAQRNPEKWWLY